MALTSFTGAASIFSVEKRQLTVLFWSCAERKFVKTVPTRGGVTRKWLILVVAFSVFVSVIFLWERTRQPVNGPVGRLVMEKGEPTFLVKQFEVVRRKVKALQLLVLPLDPSAMTNWNTVTNASLVWVGSESGRRNARFFYDEMRNDKSFDGEAWYSARSRFGERITIVQIDGRGMAFDEQTLRVDALSMQVEGFERSASSESERITAEFRTTR